MRVITTAAALVGLAVAAGPAFAFDHRCGSTVSASVAGSDARDVVVTSSSTVRQDVTITQRPPQVLGIRQASVAPPAIYVIEDSGEITTAQ